MMLSVLLAAVSVDPVDKNDLMKRFGFPESSYAYAGISLQMLDSGTLENVKLSRIGTGKRPLFAFDDCNGLDDSGLSELESF